MRYQSPNGKESFSVNFTTELQVIQLRLSILNNVMRE